MKEKRWEDFEISEKNITDCVTVTEAHLVAFSNLTGDWYPLHMDAEYANTSRFKQRIAHGPLTMSLGVGLMGRSTYYGDAIMALIGIDKVRPVLPVFIGDTIHVESEVISKKETSKLDRGVITLRYDYKNQRGETVMDLEFTLMMHRRAGPKES